MARGEGDEAPSTVGASGADPSSLISKSDDDRLLRRSNVGSSEADYLGRTADVEETLEGYARDNWAAKVIVSPNLDYAAEPRKVC